MSYLSPTHKLFRHICGPLGSYLTRLVVDLNLRKNWQAALHKRPDVVVFLGDMMDNGRLDVYEQLFTRFSDIFRLDSSIPQYFIPGNHDTGLGKSSTFSPHAFSRYISHFGPTNIEISVANHTLVLFDAPGYANEDSKRHGAKKAFTTWIPIQGGSLEYMKKFARDKHKDPVILFTHIPLYRPDGKNCGPLREKGTLRPGVGHGYQNTLEKQSSLRLLEALKPVAIFSGDDHDYCEYTHQLRPTFGPPINILETTVKSISMVMNVRKPGFQLLSLAPADLRRNEGPSYADTLCLLPDQLRIYLNIYLPLLAISIIVVFFSNLNRGKRRGHSTEFSDAHLLLSTSKLVLTRPTTTDFIY
ncbi:unnamed protein product [Cyclocybe aegerita]|uniref:Calcineurin-like phosphoesterase domain-containing protein n=1 Tax=Cyclocybe aegerita TaxID=1973307 RepID=A0A8S0XK43_CYCAE|nr:unnamed protein product [Cyclocybe aegerita]